MSLQIPQVHVLYLTLVCISVRFNIYFIPWKHYLSPSSKWLSRVVCYTVSNFKIYQIRNMLLPWPWGTHSQAFLILFTVPVQYLLQYLSNNNFSKYYTCISSIRQVANLEQAMHKKYYWFLHDWEKVSSWFKGFKLKNWKLITWEFYLSKIVHVLKNPFILWFTEKACVTLNSVSWAKSVIWAFFV